MYIDSGYIKANKKDIEAIKIFLKHAKIDMFQYGLEGSYGGNNDSERKQNATWNKGKEGLEKIEFILEGLCPKYEK